MLPIKIDWKNFTADIQIWNVSPNVISVFAKSLLPLCTVAKNELQLLAFRNCWL